ncbi:hypothetical protein PIB30_045482 [Stylosanthes scabra]|uniref:Uncharacterized protein n=1 Tax=Stylosanthes scabra TaxID=79078 RepID=A0ABU6WEF3_9FABA|nr:hypothetical protein [Stylosanthes scabra]
MAFDRTASITLLLWDDKTATMDPLERSVNSAKLKTAAWLIVTKGDGTDAKGKKPTDDE